MIRNIWCKLTRCDGAKRVVADRDLNVTSPNGARELVPPHLLLPLQVFKQQPFFQPSLFSFHLQFLRLEDETITCVCCQLRGGDCGKWFCFYRSLSGQLCTLRMIVRYFGTQYIGYLKIFKAINEPPISELRIEVCLVPMISKRPPRTSVRDKIVDWIKANNIIQGKQRKYAAVRKCAQCPLAVGAQTWRSWYRSKL